MTFSGRIRLYLVAVALLPPLLMMLVVYFYSAHQQEIEYRETASEELRKLIGYREQVCDRLAADLGDIANHGWFERAARLVRGGRSNQVVFDDLRGFGLDFCELLDQHDTVVASFHRPGLIGETIGIDCETVTDSLHLCETVEYDVRGRHAAVAGWRIGPGGYRIYGGFYLQSGFTPVAGQIFRGRLFIQYIEETNPTGSRYAAMQFGSLYQGEKTLQAILFGSPEAAFYLVADFIPPDQSAVFSSFIDVVSLVALVSVLAAVGLGFYISGRTKREFDNLIDAFGRVAGGDLGTAVMAYSEGEFSDLADSFSEMTQKLRHSQQQLATTEKIAAWQAMARKIAHEIKNPLTPIGISADDLRQSYQQKLPHFDQTLDTNTRLIKGEVGRLTRLLDEFVSFARMRSPEIKNNRLDMILTELESLYAGKISAGRLRLVKRSRRTTAALDAELIRQILVKLVKNGLEAGEDSSVTVGLDDVSGGLRLTVSDSGPGFDSEVLERRFEPYLSTKKDGSGLGLVICQRIVHDHGGRIDLANNEEGGAKVTVILPQN